MIIMAARIKKTTGVKAKSSGSMGAEEIVEIAGSPEAASPVRSLPKVDSDHIFEDDLTEEEEMAAIMKLEEISLRKFLEDEPDIYTLKDLKVRYK
jgi:uncharacterized protein involved in tolerance to divalent cations